jgi:hypothetical protein
MNRVSLFSLALAGAFGVATLVGGNGSGTGQHDPDRDINDFALAGGNGSGTGQHDPDRDINDFA